MTRVINGYAQPDIVATKGEKQRLIFIETPESLKKNAHALGKTLGWLAQAGHKAEDTEVLIEHIGRG